MNHWYVCFSVEREAVPLPQSSAAIGIDVGLDSFAVLSDGTEVENPRHWKRGWTHLRRSPRRLSRRQRGSVRRRKAAVLVAQAHRKIRNQRAAFHHDVSRWLVNRYGVIAVEDLNIQGLSRGMLAGSVSDAGWNSLFAKIAYKAEYAGRELVTVDPRGTSQTCLCGASVPKTLPERWHECPACGLSVPRDVVSAQVILQRARIGRSRRNVEDVVSCVPREASPFRRRSDHRSSIRSPEFRLRTPCRAILVISTYVQDSSCAQVTNERAAINSTDDRAANDLSPQPLLDMGTGAT